ncbi:MAG: phosphatase PAP2 family protein [bacterium]|nr:phosphatase PAP2 family protein [bacterium]
MEFQKALIGLDILNLLNTAKYQPIIFIPFIALALLLIFNILIKKHRDQFFDTIAGLIIIILFMILSAILLDTIYLSANPERVIYWSETFMRSDYKLFGTYPTFWLYKHGFSWVERPIVYTYQYLAFIISLWVIFLAFYKKGAFLSKFIKQFFIAFVICFPIWIIFPAISPADMFLANKFNRPIPETVAISLNDGPPSRFTNVSVVRFMRMWAMENKLAISTFPSMHAIWGMLLAYSIIQILKKKPYKWFAITLATTNIIGTVYIFQHYAVDILAGIAIAIIITKLNLR